MCRCFTRSTQRRVISACPCRGGAKKEVSVCYGVAYQRLRGRSPWGAARADLWQPQHATSRREAEEQQGRGRFPRWHTRHASSRGSSAQREPQGCGSLLWIDRHGVACCGCQGSVRGEAPSATPRKSHKRNIAPEGHAERSGSHSLLSICMEKAWGETAFLQSTSGDALLSNEIPSGDWSETYSQVNKLYVK